MRLFRKIRRKLDYLPEDQVNQIEQAFQLAAKAHEGQTRYTGEDYITHPVAVMEILADIRMDKDTLMAALLHDTIEDCAISKQDIAEAFGESVADLVDGVSKLTQIEFRSRVEMQAENFSKMVLAMSRDIRVIIVKLADRLHNMRTLLTLPAHKRRRIAQETLDIYAPIANRLGMHEFYLELEELGFMCFYPTRYRVMKKAIQKAVGDRKRIMSVIFKSLRGGMSNAKIEGFDVLGREKHVYSIYKKMRKKQVHLSEIMDVYGFRVIVDSVDTCYRALGIIHSLYKPIPERFKDYIAIPKANGYQSLHTTLFGPYGLPIEVQIRTKDMDELANKGVAAHWIYKSDDKKEKSSRLAQQQWLKNLIEMQKSTGNSIEFIENVKVDLFPDEVYVFTPKGEIMRLPAGSCAVDFAYAVHTDIGNTCVAAKIDRQLSPLSTKLSNGQTVEIITNPNARPNPTWLDLVVTGKAKSGLRNYLKVQRHGESVALGKRLLTKALSGLSLTFRKIPDDIIHRVLQETELTSLDDLFAEVGTGHRAPMLVAHQIASILNPEFSIKKAPTNEEAEPLVIQGTEGLVVHFGKCCYPLPGDPVVGLIHAGKGIVVHTENCKLINKGGFDPEVCLPMMWSEQVEGEFPVRVLADVLNRRGVLGDMALAIADVGANIEDIKVFERDGQHYQVAIELCVTGRKHLADAIRNLRKISSVVAIRRA